MEAMTNMSIVSYIKRIGVLALSTTGLFSFVLIAQFIVANPAYAQTANLQQTCSSLGTSDSGAPQATVTQVQSGVNLCTYYTADSTDNPDTSATTYSDHTRYLDDSGNQISYNGSSGTDYNGYVKIATTCATLNDFMSNFTSCLGRSASALIGSFSITVNAWFLELAGLLFNFLVYYTVITFGSFGGNASTLANVTNGINVGWTLFRDLSNIVIIGLFTFIAISIILGLKEYGAKKLVARVLIIAVLINFSLLFTKLIVDASNFTAYQFYNAAQINGNDAHTGVLDTSTYTQFSKTGIAGQFLSYMGITGIQSTFTSLKDGADTTQNGWVVLLHGLFSGALLCAAALVLLYGSLLLVTRAIMIIVLMLTASIAFATHLVPAFDKRGWSLWWKSLINVAIFAPVLMLFLWITLTLANALAPVSGTGTLGDLPNNPTSSGNLGALLGYVLILGLLFASFKISYTFASMASEINFATMMAGSLATGGLSSVAAFAGRNTIGRLAMSRANTRTEEAREAEAQMRKAQGAVKIHTENKNFDLAAQAQREVDRLKTTSAKKISSAARYSGIADMKFGGKTSVKSKIEERAKAGAKIAEKLKLSDDDKDRVRKEAGTKVIEARAPEEKKIREEAVAKTTELGNKKSDADTIAEAIKAATATARKPIEDAHAAAVKEETAVREDSRKETSKINAVHEPVLADLTKKIRDEEARGAAADSTKLQQLREDEQKHRSQHQADLQKEAGRIEDARKKTSELQAKLDDINSKEVTVNVTMKDGLPAKVTKSFKEATSEATQAAAAITIHEKESAAALKNYKEETEKQAKAAGENTIKEYNSGIGDTAGELARRQGGIGTRIGGWFTGDNDAAAHEAQHKFKHAQGPDASLRKALKEATKEEDEHKS